MAEQAQYQEFNLIEEITRNDGSTYYEVGNIFMNGRAELAANKHLIKQVRILQLNIPRTQSLVFYEKYINEHYQFPGTDMTQWEEWDKPKGPVLDAFNLILKANHIG